MTCTTCGYSASRLRIRKGKESCSRCGGFSEANGTRIDGVLSRQRTRDQGVKFEGDTLNPWQYSTSSKSFEPNPDFIKLHADNAMNFYKSEDLNAYPKLKEGLYDRLNSPDPVTVESVGEYAPAIQEAVDNAA